MSAIRTCVSRLALVSMLVPALLACTPAYTAKAGMQAAGRAGLVDSVELERSNGRLLSRQGQVCLLSDSAGSEAGLELLRTAQAAFSGYFVAVGIEAQSFDYLQILSAPPCAGAAYLIFLQAEAGSCGGEQSCGRGTRANFSMTIVNRGDLSLLDRVRFSVRNSWLPLHSNDSTRLRQAFEQVAAELVGTPSH